MSIARVNTIETIDGAPLRVPNGISTTPATALIGEPGARGFGVGTFHNSARFGLFPLASADDPESPTLGNYQSSNGSIFPFVPKFYYRIGHTGNATYGTYGLNSIETAGTDQFANQAAAAASGFAMPRAFIDAGTELAGFWHGKYLASRDGNTVLILPNRAPISLTTEANYTRSSDMPDCTGILADAITLARTIIPGHSYCPALWQQSALALLSLAHAQASTSAAHCAWFDGADSANFPKGCNNNALGDANDATVLYTTAGDVGNAAKPLTGSGAPFAKTTHNGQDSGIADLNGAMWRVLVGVTSPGAGAGNSAQIESKNAYVLKQSTRLADLLGGHTIGAAGDPNVWGDAAHLATLYDLVTDLFPWEATDTNWVDFGNGSNQVFSPASSGDDWLRTSIGLAKNADGMSATGTAIFGQDGNYRYNIENLCPIGSGTWNYSTTAGVFSRYWSFRRSFANLSFGFSAAVSAFG